MGYQCTSDLGAVFGGVVDGLGKDGRSRDCGLRVGFAHDHEPSRLPRLRANVRESEKVEGLRFAAPLLPSPGRRKAPKLDQPGLVDFSSGNLPNDRRHTIKVYGTYALENGLRFSSNVFWQSGRPRNCFGVHPTDEFAYDYGASSHFCQGEGVPRGSLGNTPDVMKVDLNAQYAMEFGRTDILWSLDVFNVFNSQNPLIYNEFGDTAGGTPVANAGASCTRTRLN